jgi:hypothetical protein
MTPERLNDLKAKRETKVLTSPGALAAKGGTRGRSLGLRNLPGCRAGAGVCWH